MKRIYLVLLIVLSIAFIGCNETIDNIPYERLFNKAYEEIEIPSEVTNNLSFPDKITIEDIDIFISWQTSNEAISNKGIVVRVDNDVDVTIKVSMEINGKTQKRILGTVKVLKKEKVIDYEEIANRALTSFSFPERVQDNLNFPESIIIDDVVVGLLWSTSNTQISPQGIITRGETDTEVSIILTCKVNDIVKSAIIATVTVIKNEIDYEALFNEAFNSFTFPLTTTTDLVFPNSININTKEVLLKWTTDSEAINQNGVIKRSTTDTLVKITLECSIDGKVKSKDIAFVTVLKEEIDYSLIINNALDTLEIPKYTNNDLVFLNEITILDYTVKLEWFTSNNAISNMGVINPVTDDTDVEIKVIGTLFDDKVEKILGIVTIIGRDTSFMTELLQIDTTNNTVNFENCNITNITSDTKIFEKDGIILNEITINDLIVGTKDVEVFIKDDSISQIIIPKGYLFKDIRVAIRQDINDIANINTLYHDTITLRITKKAILKTFDGEITQELKPGTVRISIKNDQISVTNNSATNLYDRRIRIIGTDEEIYIDSINRGGDKLYAGDMDISLSYGGLLLVNELNMEDYLVKVVPSEMPSSWEMEALKAQAVAARTYAYREFYNKRYQDLGYIVDDSTMSQVYNNQRENERSTNAVRETNGLVMFYKDEPIIAYYYSSSCGLTASGNEVWINDKVIEEIPYLIGKNLSKDLNGKMIEVDTTSECSMLEYFKTIRMDNPGGEVNNHRWRLSINKTQLREIINANIITMSITYPTSYPQFENGEWIVKSFPNDIGEIQDIYVSERGTSGVVVSLTVVTEKITFKIINQYNIRFTIRPRNSSTPVEVYKGNCHSDSLSYNTSNPSVLNSGFFALEWNDDVLTFYGGGNGHGCGMDQYGALYFARKGYTYQEILETYYSNITFIQTQK